MAWRARRPGLAPGVVPQGHPPAGLVAWGDAGRFAVRDWWGSGGAFRLLVLLPLWVIYPLVRLFACSFLLSFSFPCQAATDADCPCRPLVALRVAANPGRSASEEGFRRGGGGNSIPIYTASQIEGIREACRVSAVPER